MKLPDEVTALLGMDATPATARRMLRDWMEDSPDWLRKVWQNHVCRREGEPSAALKTWCQALAYSAIELAETAVRAEDRHEDTRRRDEESYYSREKFAAYRAIRDARRPR